MLEQLDVAVGDARNHFFGHLRNRLSFLALETVCHQPLADKLLGKLLLTLSPGQPFLIAVCVEIPGGIRCVHLVHQVDLAVLLSELVLGVHQDETLAGCYLGSALENGPGIFLKLFIILPADKTA